VSWNPDWVVAPGEVLSEWCGENGLTPRVAATACDIPLDVFEGILRGDAHITGEIAERLAIVVGVSPGFWLRFEKWYRDGLAAGKVRST
jgi:plasmid maintenance system antidote protein VapI